MIKLFAIMRDAGISVDPSNDNITESDQGFIWQAPLDTVPAKFPHAALVAEAERQLGDVYRGYCFNPSGNYADDGPNLEIFLSSTYTDEDAI